jgi:carboxymethylenebutenolidase
LPESPHQPRLSFGHGSQHAATKIAGVVMGKSIQSRMPPVDLTNRSFGRMVEVGKHRSRTSGYMAYSDRVGPGVILLHEFFGLQRSVTTYADALNEQGFTVLAPDLYDGAVADSVDSARAMAQALDVDRTLAGITAAAEHLTDNWHPRLGVVGFSLGADFAVALAQDLAVEATVLYYGLGEIDLAHWRCPLLEHLGESDEWVSRSEAEAVVNGLRQRDIEAEMHLYPAAGHWFANADVPDAYDPAAAQLAFERTVDFLGHHLS